MTLSHSKLLLGCAVASSALAFADAASGFTYIYEPFDYTTTGSTNDGVRLGDGNQSGALGTVGSWSTQVNNVEMEVRNESMTFTDSLANPLPVQGLSIRRTNRSGYTTNSIGIDPAATGALTGNNTTMWMSFLYEDEGFSGPDSSVMLASQDLALANNHTLSSAGYGVGIMVGEGGANSVEAAFYNNATSATRIESAFSPNGDNENITFLLAAKINWKPDGTPDEIYVFNITDLTAAPDELDAIASNTFDMPLVGQQSLSLLNIGETQIDAFDEIRVGTSFADVVATNLVPEPTSMALLGLGGLLVARRRRG